MSDEWTDQLFEASVDGMVVQLLGFDDDISRSQTVHEMVNRDGGFVADDGQVPRRSSWQLIFAEGIGNRSNEDTHLNRLQDFVRLLDGQARTVVHPVSGAFQAKPSNISFAAGGDTRAVVQMSVDWVEHRPDPVAFEVGSRLSSVDAVDSVAIVAAEADSALSAQGQSSSTPTTAIATVQAWADAATRRQRNITLEVNRLAAEIDSEANRIAVATDVNSAPIVLAFNRLQQTVTNAALRLLSNAPKLSKWVVPKNMPLYSVVQTLYGYEDSEERYNQILEANDVPDPLRVAEGQILLVEQA